MSDNKEVTSQEIEAHTVLFQNHDPAYWYNNPALDAIKVLLPKVDEYQRIEIRLSVNLVELKKWHTESWARARPHSLADKIYVNEPNPWLSKYPEKERYVVMYDGKNEANNPLNRIYNEKLLELSREDDTYPWDEIDNEEVRADARLAAWVNTDNYLTECWMGYIDSGLAGKVSFDEFVDAYRNMRMIFIRELVEQEGERVANEHVPSFPLSEEAKEEFRKLWKCGGVR